MTIRAAIVRIASIFALSALLFGAFIPAVTSADNPNLITNPSFENGVTGWGTVAGSGNSVGFSYPVAGFDGQHAAGIKITRYSSGDVFWQPKNAPVTAGQKYTFSGYSQNSIPVAVVATYLNQNGSAVSYATLGTVPASASWQQFSASITIPSNVTQVRIQHVIRAVGTLNVDQYSLTLGTTATSTPPPPPQAPVINSFTANPTTIVAGQSSTLSWSLTNATSFAVMQGSSVLSQSGTTLQVTPSATTTYTIAAYNGGTATTTATATVNVAPKAVTPPPPPQAPTCTIAANPTAITSGQSSTLSWSSTNASSSSIDNGIGNVPASGTKTVSPTATTTYTMTVGNVTATSTCKTTVNVAPVVVTPPPTKPFISSFTATPSNITAGQSSTLAWNVTGATLLSIDQNVGTVTGTSKAVSPAATTTYTLSAGNSAGTTTATVTVNVAPVVVTPPSNNLVANGNFEAGTSGNPTNWTHDFWGTMTPTFTYPVTGNGGGKAVQISVSSFTSGAANWIFPHITDSSHNQYSYSEDYMATVPTEIDIEYLMSDGSFDYEWFMTLPAASTWQTVTGQITPPQGAVSFTVLDGISAKGTLTLDNISVSALTDPLPQGMVTLAFDDGLLSQYQNAAPMLKTAGLTAGFYIITTEPTSGDSGQMTWAQVKTLKSEGFEIGGHTRTHPFLTQLTASQITNEVSGSFQDLVAQGLTPKSFVYPYGDLNPTVENAVKTAGYTVARGSYSGQNGAVSDRYDLYDLRLDQTTTIAKAEAEIDQAIADKRWVVFEIHDVLASGGDEYSITPSFLQTIVNYLKQKNADVVTLEQGSAFLK